MDSPNDHPPAADRRDFLHQAAAIASGVAALAGAARADAPADRLLPTVKLGPHAVTVATNMAGRGVDILLCGNPEGLARQELLAEGSTPDASPERFAWCRVRISRIISAENANVVASTRNATPGLNTATSTPPTSGPINVIANGRTS